MAEFKRKQYAKAVLTNYHTLKERRFVGDVGASDTLIDFEYALVIANLTNRQLEALWLIYDEDLTQKEAGERMGIGQDVVSEHIRKATEEIDEVYEMWAWMAGELKASDFAEEAI